MEQKTIYPIPPEAYGGEVFPAAPGFGFASALTALIVATELVLLGILVYAEVTGQAGVDPEGRWFMVLGLVAMAAAFVVMLIRVLGTARYARVVVSEVGLLMRDWWRREWFVPNDRVDGMESRKVGGCVGVLQRNWRREEWLGPKDRVDGMESWMVGGRISARLTLYYRDPRGRDRSRVIGWSAWPYPEAFAEALPRAIAEACGLDDATGTEVGSFSPPFRAWSRAGQERK